eukprot:1840331-Rhodomonas_salina.2
MAAPADAAWMVLRGGVGGPEQFDTARGALGQPPQPHLPRPLQQPGPPLPTPRYRPRYSQSVLPYSYAPITWYKRVPIHYQRLPHVTGTDGRRAGAVACDREPVG